MQSLDIIKRRIKTVQTTAKITNAMKLVSIAKIKKQMAEFKVVSDFCKDFYDIIQEVTKGILIEELFPTSKSDATLHILITSSLGLCGAFNTNVCKLLLEHLKPNDKIVVFGKKGFNFLKIKGLEHRVLEMLEISDTDTDYLELLPITDTIIKLFINGEVSKINLVYTKFINAISFNPVCTQVLPLSQELFLEKGQHVKKTYTTLSTEGKEIQFEPNRIRIIQNVLPTYLVTLTFAGIAESKVCENGARRNAMETASDNAKDLIEDLTLQFNRARQEGITQEINEIVAGSGQGA
jgi:F-type H+-transporting ATPase subunit gamma